MRVSLIVLVIIIVFLAGMLMGITNDKDLSLINKEAFIGADALNEPDEFVELIEYNANNFAVANGEETIHFIQGFASYLEKLTVGFFNMVVGFLYEFSRLFF